MKSVLIRDYMTRKVFSLDPDMEISAATNFLVKNDISGAPVLDKHGRLVGILTERDCIKVVMHAGYHDTLYGLVREYMSTNPESVSPEQSIVTLAEKFIDGKFRRYPVLDNGRLVGVISRRDVLRVLVDKTGRSSREPTVS